MGLYVDDIRVQAKQDGNEIEKLLYKGFSEMNELFEKGGGVISLVRNDTIEEWDLTKSSKKNTPPSSLPLELPIVTETFGTISMRYSKFNPVKRGKQVLYPDFKLFVYDKLIIQKSDTDLAWFLISATDFFVKKEGKGSQNYAFLSIEDPAAEIKEKASELKKIASVDRFLSYPDSVLLNAGILRKIADRFGIEVKNEYNVDVFAYFIREAVIAGEQSKNPDLNIDKFVSYAKKLESNILKNMGEVVTKKEDVVTKKEDVVTKKEESHEPEDESLYEEEDTPVYSVEYLDTIALSERNLIAKKFGIGNSPPMSKIDQIAEIIERQKINV